MLVFLWQLPFFRGDLVFLAVVCMYTGVISTFYFAFLSSLKSTANCCGFGTWLLSIYRKVVSSPPPCRYLLACSSSINRSNVFHYFTSAIFYLFGKLVTLTTAVLLIIPHVILQSHYTSYDYWDVLASYQSLPPTTSLWTVPNSERNAQTSNSISINRDKTSSVDEPW